MKDLYALRIPNVNPIIARVIHAVIEKIVQLTLLHSLINAKAFYVLHGVSVKWVTMVIRCAWTVFAVTSAIVILV